MADQEIFRDALYKEIDLIQDIIRRMASNSFMIKGWSITLVVATLLLKGSKYQVSIALIPLFSFWVLDAYFIRQERLYRKLYEWVIANRLKTEDYLFDLNAYRFTANVQSTFRIMFSTTLAWFYLLVFILIMAYLGYLFII
jgi:hypothetical protein